MNKSSYDERKEKAAKQMKKERMMKRLKQAIIPAVVVLSLGTGIYWWVRSEDRASADRKIYAVNIPELGREHIPVGSRRPAYNSNPPTSGPHYGTPEPRGVYDKQLPDEELVHNLEHGYVWISYRPDAGPEIRKQLESFYRFRNKVIVTPRRENEKLIALAAWGWLDTFDSAFPAGLTDAEKKRIDDFVGAFINQGPEPLGQ